MFNLRKDLDTDKYKGIPPYASEHYGIYQPLLGWDSKLTKKWIQRGGTLIEPRVKRILDGRILPGPTEITGELDEFLAIPLKAGTGQSPFKVILAKDLNSEWLKIIRSRVQRFVENHNGRLPEGDEWTQEIVSTNDLVDGVDGIFRTVNAIYLRRLIEGPALSTPEVIATARKNHLELMQYESQIATFFWWHARPEPGYDANELKKLFSVQTAPPLSDILRPTDPLANIDPNDKSGALSPVGYVHLFRQYFFDLGTFLGEPVEHIWLAPGTTIELIEVSTRKTIIERTQESAQETTTRSEESTVVKDELSDAVKSETANSTKLGVSTTSGVNFGVYQGSATASFGVESSRKDARENTHKQSREQTEKLSSDIKRSFKSVFKTVTETTDTRSRRYVLQNPTPNLINYELRRKMRRVGVQLQDLGSQLCWQVFIDNAGVELGLAELVHFAESPDLANLKQPEIGPPPTNIKTKVAFTIPFRPTPGYSNWSALYNWWQMDPTYPTLHIGRDTIGDEDDEHSNIIMGPFNFKTDPPQIHYKLSTNKDDINILGPQANKLASVKDTILKDDGSIDIIMQQINFGQAHEVKLDVELKWIPIEPACTDAYKATVKLELDKYNAEVSRLRKKSFMESVRQRIKDASSIKPRPSWDLREEERTIIYRKLIERLMLDSWDLARKDPKDNDNARLSHVRSEVIRAIFDVDAMLYFVAPEWWMPRKRSQLNLNPDMGDPKIHLTDNDVVKWDDIENRKDNYKITEDSAPAKLGSSLGWLLQLDGDNLRNAFLNAPWVKAIIPIRPGREKAALNWLRSIEGHENDGWNTPYLGSAAEDAEFRGKTIGEVLETIADRMEKQNGDIKNVLEADKVFEHGFDHLAGGFDAGLPANKVFSQWVSVLPTDQIVAVEYEPTNLLEP
jgi:hypothetical protein